MLFYFSQMPTCILNVSLLCLAYALWSLKMRVVFLPAPFLSSDLSSLFFLPHNLHFCSLVPTEMDFPSFFTLNSRRGSIDNRRGMVVLLSPFFFFCQCHWGYLQSALCSLCLEICLEDGQRSPQPCWVFTHWLEDSQYTMILRNCELKLSRNAAVHVQNASWKGDFHTFGAN